MLRINDIQEKLLHLIGWAQEPESNVKISNLLTQSETGMFFQQVHPLLTLQNIASIAPNFENTDIQRFIAGIHFSKGSLVEYDGSIYRAKTDIIAYISNAPKVDSATWECVENLFSIWLENKTKSSIQKAIFRYYNEKINKGTHKVLCENKVLFNGTGRIVDTVKNKHNLVGFEIVPVRAKGVTTKINKIGLQFTEPGKYILYLMHSGSNTPIKVIEVNKIKKNSTEWFTFSDLYLPYQGEDSDVGGSWYLCYSQDELPVKSQAIKKDKDWSKEPCKSCSRKEYITWEAWSKYIEIHPFYINVEKVYADIKVQITKPADSTLQINVIKYIRDTLELSLQEAKLAYDNLANGIPVDIASNLSIQDAQQIKKDFISLCGYDGIEIIYYVDDGNLQLWDVSDNIYTYDNNYGINLDITVECDISDFIIEQKMLFQDIIAKQVAVDMLREFAYNANVRTNRHSINASRTDILYEVDGDSASMKKSGLGYQLDKAFDSVELITEGLDRVCLPCKNNGIKYRVV